MAVEVEVAATDDAAAAGVVAVVAGAVKGGALAVAAATPAADAAAADANAADATVAPVRVGSIDGICGVVGRDDGAMGARGDRWATKIRGRVGASDGTMEVANKWINCARHLVIIRSPPQFFFPH